MANVKKQSWLKIVLRIILVMGLLGQVYFFFFTTETAPRGIHKWNPELAESSAKAFLAWRDDPTEENAARWRAEEGKVQHLKIRRIMIPGLILVVVNFVAFVKLWNFRTKSKMQ